MNSIQRILVFGLIAVTTTSCVRKAQIAAILQDNPEIIYDALAKDPAKFAAIAQKASNDARRAQMEKQREEEKKQIAAAIKNPINVELPKGRAVRGNASAPIQIVEFSDFECPFCKRGYDTVEALREKYKEKVFFVYRHLPLPMHPMAVPAAKRFEAIALQSQEKAYKYHDELFKNQKRISAEGEKYLDEAAKTVGANVAKMKTDMEGAAVKARLEEDKSAAQVLGFTGTPAFVVAGVPIKGAQPISSFEEILTARNVASAGN